MSLDEDAPSSKLVRCMGPLSTKLPKYEVAITADTESLISVRNVCFDRILCSCIDRFDEVVAL